MRETLAVALHSLYITWMGRVEVGRECIVAQFKHEFWFHTITPEKFPNAWKICRLLYPKSCPEFRSNYQALVLSTQFSFNLGFSANGLIYLCRIGKCIPNSSRIFGERKLTQPPTIPIQTLWTGKRVDDDVYVGCGDRLFLASCMVLYPVMQSLGGRFPLPTSFVGWRSEYLADDSMTCLKVACYSKVVLKVDGSAWSRK